jgi:hypothetical protein
VHDLQWWWDLVLISEGVGTPKRARPVRLPYVSGLSHLQISSDNHHISNSAGQTLLSDPHWLECAAAAGMYQGRNFGCNFGLGAISASLQFRGHLLVK